MDSPAALGPPTSRGTPPALANRNARPFVPLIASKISLLGKAGGPTAANSSCLLGREKLLGSFIGLQWDPQKFLSTLKCQ